MFWQSWILFTSTRRQCGAKRLLHYNWLKETFNIVIGILEQKRSTRLITFIFIPVRFVVTSVVSDFPCGVVSRKVANNNDSNDFIHNNNNNTRILNKNQSLHLPWYALGYQVYLGIGFPHAQQFSSGLL